MVGANRTQHDEQIIRRSTWLCRAGYAMGIALLILGGLTWSTDTYGGVIGLVAGAVFISVGLYLERRLRMNPQEIVDNHAALEERDRQLPLWRHAFDWLIILLVGTATAAWMMATGLPADYGPGLTIAWSAVAAVFFVECLAMLAWSISRYRRSRRAPS